MNNKPLIRILILILMLIITITPLSAQENNSDLDKDYITHIIQGRNAFKERKCDVAITEFNKALSGIVESSIVRTELGHAYSCTGDEDSALLQYKKAAEVWPENPDAYYNQGVSYMILDKQEEAITAFNKGLELVDSFMEPNFNKKSFKLDTIYILGKIYDQAKQTEKAVAVYQNILKIDPDNSDAKFYLKIHRKTK